MGNNTVDLRIMAEYRRLQQLVTIGSSLCGINLMGLDISKLPPGARIKGAINNTVEKYKLENNRARTEMTKLMNEKAQVGREAEQLRWQLKRAGIKPCC